MAALHEVVGELVAASRILANEGICDAFGHISARHPDHPDRYLLSRARAPELVERGDIMQFALDGTPLEGDDRKPFLERFIHGALYEARPDIHAVVHSHSRTVVCYSISDQPVKPVMHSCACIGHDVPVWDAQDSFGDTDLLISDLEMGRDFGRVFGAGYSALMRGHGSTVGGITVRGAVYTAIYLEVNAGLQMQAGALGPVKALTPGEIDKVQARLMAGRPGEGYSRAWDYWCRRAGVEPETTGA